LIFESFVKIQLGMIINNKMQGITQKLAYYFGNLGRVPSIKFLGPRSQLQHNHPKAETHHHHNQKPKAASKSSLSGPSVNFTDFSTKL
jgi:hypothetical protein